MTDDPYRILSTSIRVPADTLDRWREEYAQTFPEHRLSLNLFLVEMVEAGIKYCLRDESQTDTESNTGDKSDEDHARS